MTFDFSRFAEVYRCYDTGVYGLVHPVRQRVYVGATMQGFRQCWNRHRAQLDANSHEVPRLQHDWLLDGGQAFSFVVLQELPQPHGMLIYEQFWLEAFRGAGLDCYNHLPTTAPALVPAPLIEAGVGHALYTPQELACYLRVSKRTVDRWIRRAKLHVVDGGVPQVRITLEDLSQFIAPP